MKELLKYNNKSVSDFKAGPIHVADVKLSDGNSQLLLIASPELQNLYNNTSYSVTLRVVINCHDDRSLYSQLREVQNAIDLQQGRVTCLNDNFISTLCKVKDDLYEQGVVITRDALVINICGEYSIPWNRLVSFENLIQWIYHLCEKQWFSTELVRVVINRWCTKRSCLRLKWLP